MSLLQKVFKELKGSLPLRKPIFDYKTRTAEINLKNLMIKVNPHFVQELISKGLTEELALKGLLNHEIGHYKHHPFDLETILLEISALESKGVNLAYKALYDDFINNTGLIVEANDEGLSDVYKALSDDNSEILRILSAFYQRLSGDDYGILTLSNKSIKKLEELRRLNYTCSKYYHKKQVIEFYEIFKDYDLKQDMSLEELMSDLKKVFSEEEIGKTLKKLIDKGQIDKSIAERIASTTSIKSSDYFDEKMFDKHRRLANECRIMIESLSERSGGSIPYSPEELSIEDLSSFDPFISLGSGGAPIPNLANKWSYSSQLFNSREESLNDLIICIDSSGSMINPSIVLSGAVVSGMALAREYLSKGSQVSVINFSIESMSLDFSSDLSSIDKILFHYFGNGTVFDNESLKKLINQDKYCDVVVITDEAISNYDSFIDYFKTLKQKNHLYIFSLSTNDLIEKEGNIRRVSVSRPADIKKIVMSD